MGHIRAIEPACQTTCRPRLAGPKLRRDSETWPSVDGVCTDVHTCQVGFEWDGAKASANLLKHGVSFADAVGVFGDLNALAIDDDTESERRFVALGLDFLGRLLVVVYTWRGDAIRVISARKATRAEARSYADQLP